MKKRPGTLALGVLALTALAAEPARMLRVVAGSGIPGFARGHVT